MDPEPVPAAFGQHGLGPHVVGQRVVIRRLLPDQTGPTGGPAFTDVLGVCERWSDGEAVVRCEDGTVVTVPTHVIVSGKPVPPRASRLARLSREQIDSHLREPGTPVWLGALSQLARRFGAEESAVMSGSGTALTCELGEHVAHGVIGDAWLVVERLDDLVLLGALLERAAEEGVSIVAFTDPRAADLAEELDLISR